MWKAASQAALGKSLERKNTSGLSGELNTEETDVKNDKLRKRGNSTSEQLTDHGNDGDVMQNIAIQKMSIRKEDLLLIRKPLPDQSSKQITRNKYVVKKRTAPHDKVRESKTFIIARPAPADAELKPIDYSGPSGPRYNQFGEITPHSLLGSTEDFVLEAIKQQHILPNAGSNVVIGVSPQKINIKEIQREMHQKSPQIRMAINQENALSNWQKKMADRKRQQGYISNLLQKPVGELVMHNDSEYRKVQEIRKLVDRAIPAVDYGKGYRVGSEFWNQHESFGDDFHGIKMTLTKTEQGVPVEFEHVERPSVILQETGVIQPLQKTTMNTRRQWKSSIYLKERYHQLKPVINQLDSLDPKISSLHVLGQRYGKENLPNDIFTKDFGDNYTGGIIEHEKVYNEGEEHVDPLEKYLDVFPHAIIGPSIVFDGSPAAWNGSSSKHCGEIGCIARVHFEASSGKRTTSHLKVHNNGTTTIYFYWRLVVTSPSFDSLKTDNIQRFYFNNGEGSILPGETKLFPFVFKSSNPGIFKETWQFLPEPVLLGGASLSVVLKGIATENDVDNDVRNKILAELSAKEAEIAAKAMIDELIRAIKIPERPSSAVDANITEKQMFERKNPGYQYDYETILELKNFYSQLFPEETQSEHIWSLSLSDLKDSITAVSEENVQEELLNDLQTVINRLCLIPVTPSTNDRYNVCYRLLQEAIDSICSCSMKIRNVMQLPEIVMEAVADVDMSAAAQAPAAEVKDDKKGKGAKKNAPKEDSKAKGKPGKKDGKEKDRPKSKDVKGGKGKGTPTVTTPTKEAFSEKDILVKTPPGTKLTSADSLDRITRLKYTEKMYPQVYNIICDKLDDMSDLFENIAV